MREIKMIGHLLGFLPKNHIVYAHLPGEQLYQVIGVYSGVDGNIYCVCADNQTIFPLADVVEVSLAVQREEKEGNG